MSFITLTGADNSTPQEKLFEIGSSYLVADEILAEWGILYSASQQGSGRYPSFQWIEQLAELLSVQSLHRPSFALHICGRAVQDYLDGKGHVTQVAKYFNRIQINFRSENYDIAQVKEALVRNVGQTIITQYNDANKHLWQLLREYPNHAILFDWSGGRGVSPDAWPSTIDGVACGYAGGLGSSNLASELPRIHAVVGGSQYWVDMEGKLRDENDQFNLILAQACLHEASIFRINALAKYNEVKTMSKFLAKSL